MSEPLPMLTQAKVESELQRLSDKMDEDTRELGRLTEAEARAEVSYKRSYALRYTQMTSGSVKDREQHALLACMEDFERYRLAEALVKAVQESLRTTRAQLDALRTIAANIRGLT